MEKNINSVVLGDFGRRLQEARARKGLTQRALSERAGVPQAHISKIEQGRVDIRLSSLVELARALDLDVQLLPRQTLPAVEGVVRAVESNSDDATESRTRATLARHAQNLEAIRLAYPNLEAARKLSETFRTLQLPKIDSDTLKALERAVSPAEQLKKNPADFDVSKIKEILDRTNSSLRFIRNAQIHAPVVTTGPVVALPAYSLDSDDDDD